MNLDRRGGREELGGVEEGKTVSGYIMWEKHLFWIKMEQKKRVMYKDTLPKYLQIFSCTEIWRPGLL